MKNPQTPVTINYGKGSTLTDEQKIELYLAGVIKNISDKSPVLKNKIIEKSLNDKWLTHALLMSHFL